ncbi:MAG: sialate O-acetylesterase [Candidatus Latescibacteria bacterium]|jgi:sialate O-acetylesterase|nr:sialate O-acetylesterase [Candidatus Latescibacterota bacterium]
MKRTGHSTFIQKYFLTTAIIILSHLLPTGSVLSDVSLPGIFGDGMVLQQGMKIPVWGKADPREKVTVSINGRTKSTKTKGDGTWMVKMKKMNAGGPYEMEVSGTNEIRFTDVMIGEVWVCSGQSNMNFRIRNLGDIPGQLGDADTPEIRMVTINTQKHEQPQDDFIREKPAWIPCSSQDVGNFSAVAYFFGRDIHQELGVAVGLINASWGGTQAESWTPFEEIKSHPELNPIIHRWEELIVKYPETNARYEKEFAEWKKLQSAGKIGSKRPYAPPGSSRADLPGGIYNAMIHPLIPYGMKGVIWYQGESNSQRGYQYRTLFKTMIRSWREKWGQGTFPFLFVQLSNWETDTNPYTPKDGGNWPELREAQFIALELPKTAMAVTIDLGEKADIHPKNKWDVGCRLALAALHIAYGGKAEYSGPLYYSMKIKNDSVMLRFHHADGLTVKGGPLKGFEIAGDDRTFHAADARIEGNCVIVSGNNVKEPKAVRYAWDDYPQCNLYNSAGLPASPFRTDDWPRETEGRVLPFDW